MKNLTIKIILRLLILEHKFKRIIKKSTLLKKFVHKDLLSLQQKPLSRGLAIGIFCALLPMPFQMVPAIIMCWIGFANIPIAILCVWISNPLTYAPIFYLCYQIGALLNIGNADNTNLSLNDFSEIFIPLFTNIINGEIDLLMSGNAAGNLLLDFYMTILYGGLFSGMILAVVFYYLGYPLSRYITKYIKKRYVPKKI